MAMFIASFLAVISIFMSEVNGSQQATGDFDQFEARLARLFSYGCVTLAICAARYL